MELLLGSVDLLVHNANLATLVDRGSYGVIEEGCVAVEDGRIAWLGPRAKLPEELTAARESLDCGGAWLTPGLIDPHTHLVFGGTRRRDFARRLEGATYAQIAEEGGGIVSTVRHTREAPDEVLLETGRQRLRTLIDHGVTTVEIKSGYGLDVEHELRMLRVARRLGAEEDATVSTTLLGAHALPPGEGDRASYLDLVCAEMIPRAVEEALADAVDAFCEGIAFSPDECRRVLEVGASAGLAGRLHADQLSDLGGAALAAEVGARSADHLEYASAEGVRAMAETGAVAVLLPGAFYFLHETRKPPLDAMRAAGTRIALGTDLNPGSSPLTSPLLAMNLGCVLFGLTPLEALAGMTREAAGVLGMDGERGTLAVGRCADLAAWDVEHPDELAYWIGANPCRAVVQAGQVVRRR